MSTAKPSGESHIRAKKRKTAHNVWGRTQLLVEVLLEVMEKEVGAQDQDRSDQWLKLFGPKDSAVVNLQKLVDLLAELQQHRPARKRTAQKVSRVNDDELAMLADWIRCSDASAVNVSPVAE